MHLPVFQNLYVFLALQVLFRLIVPLERYSPLALRPKILLATVILVINKFQLNKQKINTDCRKFIN